MIALILAAALPLATPRLTPGIAVERELAAGAADVFLVTAAAGRPLLVTIEQLGIDVEVGATAPDGRALAALDSPNGRHGPEILLLPDDAAGDYRVQVRSPSRGVAAGRYRASVAELPTASAEERAAVGGYAALTEAARLYRQATAAQRRAAVARLEAALAVWTRLDRARDKAETLLLLAAAHRALGEPRPALDLYAQALAAWRSLGDASRQADTLLGMGLVQWELGDSAAARGTLDLALARFTAAGDRGAAAAARNNLCLLMLSTGDLAGARPCFEAVLADLAPLGDQGRQAAALNSLGGVWDGLGGTYHVAVIKYRGDSGLQCKVVVFRDGPRHRDENSVGTWTADKVGSVDPPA